MSENILQEEQAPPQPQYQPGANSITRRTFLKGAVAVAARLFLPYKLPDSHMDTKTTGQPDSFENRVEQLKDKVKDTETVSFLERSLIASKNLEELAQRPEVGVIRELVQERFSNPDIDIDEQIFFLRDQKTLQQAIERLEQLHWKSEESHVIQQQTREILETSPFSVTLREDRNPPNERSRSPKAIVENYERMGAKKEGGEISIGIGIQTGTPESVTRANQLEKIIVQTLSALPLGDIQVSAVIWAVWREGESISGSYFYRPWLSPKPSIEYHFQASPPQALSERELLFILHEAAHSMDIEINPNLVEFLSAENIVQLALLREQAKTNSLSVSVEKLFAAKQLRGEKVALIDGMVGNDYNKAVDWRSWFILNSSDTRITSEELDVLTKVYPETAWFWLAPLLRPWYQQFQIDLNDALKNNTTSIRTWEEFLDSNQNALDKLKAQDPIFRLGFELLSDRIDSIDNSNLQGLPALHWQYTFSKAVEATLAEDLLTLGKNRELLGSSLYAQLIKEFLLEYQVSEREGFADGAAFLLFLQSQRGQNPDDLNSPYWKYFEKLHSVMPQPRILR